MEMIRLGYQIDRPVNANDVRESAERMMATMQTKEHQQTAYCDSMERAMAFTDETMESGEWRVIQTDLDHPFVIGDAPVISWQRLDNGVLLYGMGFATPNVEIVLPIASTVCLQILPAVQRTLQVRQPSINEVNRAQAAFSTRYCYAHKNDPIVDQDLQSQFNRNRIGINSFSVRHRNYSDTMFELLMSGGSSFRAPRR